MTTSAIGKLELDAEVREQVEQELRGKKLSWVNWEQHANMESWMAKLFEAYGFPNAQR